MPGTIDLASLGDYRGEEPSGLTKAEAVAFPLFMLGIKLSMNVAMTADGFDIEVYPDHEAGETYSKPLYSMLIDLYDESDCTMEMITAALRKLADELEDRKP